ncbi:MAG: hypothetical protein PHX41_15075 [Kiritimatiellae bacterium]|nr:hypothetical protein [Kiritimatiellia bacterium]
MRRGLNMSCAPFVGCLVLSCLTGCSAGDTAIVKHQSEVEISPGKWLILERETEVYRPEWEARNRPKKNPHRLTFLDAIRQFADSAPDPKAADTILNLEGAFTLEWKGRKVAWKGKEFLITLREHAGTLYMAGFNRQDIDKCRLVFSKLRDKGDCFEMISPADFPRQIATQNFSLSLLTGKRQIRVGDDLIDSWQVLRTLDIQNPSFGSIYNLTAAMWYQIETGTEYWRISDSDLTQQFLQDYVAKYKPIALPTIIKEPPAQATTNTVSNVMINK